MLIRAAFSERFGTGGRGLRLHPMTKQALRDYEEPAMDPAIREELDAYVARRREEIARSEG